MVNIVRAGFQKWKAHAKHWKGEIVFLVMLLRHPKLPRVAKIMVYTLLSYIFSPIDLVPDFVPIFGHWDDLFMIPVTIKFVGRITPEEVIQEVRQELAERGEVPLFGGIATKIAAVTVLLLWVALSWGFMLLLGVNEHLPFKT